MTTVAVGVTGVEIGRFEPGSLDWHAARSGPRLGGSEIAAVVGLSPWESRFSLWLRKNGEIGPQAENPEMEWGKRLEDAVAGKFTDEHPELTVRPAATYQHRDRPWQLANPDRLVYPHGDPQLSALWEGKTALYPDDWGDPGTDEIPVYYRCQALWYLDVLGLDTAHISVLIGGYDYREYVLRYNEDEARILRDAGAEFIQSLQDGTRPSIDEHTATYTAVRKLHPDIDPVDVDIPADLADAYIAAYRAHKAAEAQKRGATARVADAIGGGRRAMSDGRVIACRVPGRNGSPPHLTPARWLSKETPTS